MIVFVWAKRLLSSTGRWLADSCFWLQRCKYRYLYTVAIYRYRYRYLHVYMYILKNQKWLKTIFVWTVNKRNSSRSVFPLCFLIRCCIYSEDQGCLCDWGLKQKSLIMGWTSGVKTKENEWTVFVCLGIRVLERTQRPPLIAPQSVAWECPSG